MVYAYPLNITFAVKQIKKRKISEEAIAVKEYCETHDISIIKDKKSGELVARVTNKSTNTRALGV